VPLAHAEPQADYQGCWTGSKRNTGEDQQRVWRWLQQAGFLFGALGMQTDHSYSQLPALSEPNLIIDEDSVRFLLETLKSATGQVGAKIVLAKVGDKYIIGLGPMEQYHVDILQAVTIQVLNRSVLTKVDVDSPEIEAGVIVEGGAFVIDGGTVKVGAASKAFGGFEVRHFTEPTPAVLGRFLQSACQEILGDSGPLAMPRATVEDGYVTHPSQK
jgi:hypothetical protein